MEILRRAAFSSLLGFLAFVARLDPRRLVETLRLLDLRPERRDLGGEDQRSARAWPQPAGRRHRGRDDQVPPHSDDGRGDDRRRVAAGADRNHGRRATPAARGRLHRRLRVRHPVAPAHHPGALLRDDGVGCGGFLLAEGESQEPETALGGATGGTGRRDRRHWAARPAAL